MDQASVHSKFNTTVSDIDFRERNTNEIICEKMYGKKIYNHIVK